MKKYLLAGGFFIGTLPPALCQDNGEYPTGFSVSGPFIGIAIILGLLVLLWLLRKIIIAGVTALIFGGVGYLIGSMFLPKFAAYLGIGFFFLSLWISLKMLKRGGLRSSMDDDEWDDEE